MKKFIILVMVVTTIKAQLCAQSNEFDSIFLVPADRFDTNFYMDLEKGNKILFDLTDLTLMHSIKNLDSLLLVFFRDIDQLKETMGEGIGTRRIDYLMNPSGINKIRIQQNKAGETYVSQNGKISLLKVGQDSIYITGRVPQQAGNNGPVTMQYFRISMFLNDITDLKNLLVSGVLDNLGEFTAEGKFNKVPPIGQPPKMDTSIAHRRELRPGSVFDDTVAITTKSPLPRSTLTFTGAAGLQNYKNYFVPLLSANIELTSTGIKKQTTFGLRADCLFSFERNSAGTLKTNTSYLVGISYEQKKVSGDPSKPQMPFYMSLGYVVNSSGTIIEKETFRLGLGRASLFGGNTRIEPVIYFRDLFKGLSPGIVFIQHF